MDILKTIIADKRQELKLQKQRVPMASLEDSFLFNRKTFSLRDRLADSSATGIIAEFKRKSPSRGLINEKADPVKISKGYVQAGAIGLSVLTDTRYFAGNREDLVRVRETNQCPILRKDFMIDEYQVLEARAWGADVILLIAAVLEKDKVRDLSAMAHSLGLEVLLEIHQESELDFLDENIDLVGVNNRDLKRMVADVNTSIALSEKIPADFLKISESGISDPGTILKLKEYEYRGFLIGEYFMQHDDPVKACRELIEGLQNVENNHGINWI
ncbi:MAG: indole-3-glycerol phosphate synthase [Bacteroides sp. SM23_62]|nr:MAG: indole-3-glycerol phosphate synthase [Bacteroides sp. SM23_62]